MDLLQVVFAPLGALGTIIVDAITGNLDQIPGDLETIGNEVLDSLQDLSDSILSIFGTSTQGIVAYFLGIPDAVISGLSGAASAVGSWLSDNIPFADQILGSLSATHYPSGGYVGASGLAWVEEGEYIQNRYQGRTTTGTQASGGATGFSIGTLIMQGQWKDGEDLYQDFIRRMQRESRRVR